MSEHAAGAGRAVTPQRAHVPAVLRVPTAAAPPQPHRPLPAAVACAEPVNRRCVGRLGGRLCTAAAAAAAAATAAAVAVATWVLRQRSRGGEQGPGVSDRHGHPLQPRLGEQAPAAGQGRVCSLKRCRRRLPDAAAHWLKARVGRDLQRQGAAHRLRCAPVLLHRQLVHAQEARRRVFPWFVLTGGGPGVMENIPRLGWGGWVGEFGEAQLQACVRRRSAAAVVPLVAVLHRATAPHLQETGQVVGLQPLQRLHAAHVRFHDCAGRGWREQTGGKRAPLILWCVASWTGYTISTRLHTQQVPNQAASVRYVRNVWAGKVGRVIV